MSTSAPKVRNPDKYHLGGLSFGRLSDVKKHCQALLHGGSIARSFDPGSPEFDFLSDLLDRHERSSDKIGAGITSFGIKPLMGSRCFVIWRVDGTCEEFSFNRCLRQPAPSTERSKAFREEVKDQVYEFRLNALAAPEPRCAITNRVLTNENAEVDHVVEFWRLVTNFALENNLVFSRIDVERGEQQNFIVDRRIALLWKDYHRQHAQLRLLHREAHVERTAESRRKD